MWVVEYPGKRVEYKTKSLVLRNTYHADGTRIRKEEYDALKSGDTVFRIWYEHYAGEESFYIGDGTQMSKPYVRRVQVKTLRPVVIREV